MFIRFFLLLCLFATPSVLLAEKSPSKNGPRIGLVLEGGGALGFAHVGVLKVLEEERIPVHFVAGTSMGSIVGAAYASGRTIKEIEEVMDTTDWDAVFNESPPREMVHFRHKSGRGSELYGDAKLGIKDGELVLPTAVVEGQFIELLTARLFGKSIPDQSFDNLPIPYRAVAADLETGEPVVLARGSLAKAARASMSVPGFFTPVEIDGRLLVDGGITNNFPVDLALDWGADHIIAVQFNNPLRKRADLDGPLAISAQILDLLLKRTSEIGIQQLRERDVLIQPDISKYSSTSFKEAVAIMKAGEEAARALVSRLRTFAIPAEAYEEYSRGRTGKSDYTPIIDYVRVEGARSHRAEKLSDGMRRVKGKPLNRDQIERIINTEFETGEYVKINYDVEEKEGKRGLVIQAQEKDWLENYLRLGFSIEDNFSGDGFYSLALNARFNDLNQWGAYGDTQLEIGRSPGFFTELYQPLGEDGLFFVAPEFDIGRRQLTIRQEGEDVASYLRETAAFAMKGGVALGRFGEFALGLRRGLGRLERDLGDPTLPEFDYDIGEAFSALSLDQLDNPDFPTEGYRFAWITRASRDSLGGNREFEQTRVLASLPLTSGNTTVLLNGEAGISSDNLPVEQSLGLGGVFDISGYEQLSLTADNFWVGRLITYNRFAKGASSLLNFGGYVGATLEYASLRSEIEAIGDHPDIVAGSVFIGADTPLLPVYLSFGLSDESERAVYLNIGRLSARRR